MVNGFVKIAAHEQVMDDFILTFYGVLMGLRMVDLSVIKLMYSSQYLIEQGAQETLQDIMARHGIDYSQYQPVGRNLLRIGLLTTKTDLNIIGNLDEISKTFKNLFGYLTKLKNPKFKGTIPKLKESKFKSADN